MEGGYIRRRMRSAPAGRSVTSMWRRLTPAQLGVDILIAVGFFLLLLLSTWQVGRWALLVLAGFTVALALRRVAPGVALAVGWLVAIVQMLLGVLPNPANVVVFVLVYTAAAYGSSLTRWAAFASSFVAPITITLYVLADEGFGQLDMCLTFQYQYCASYVPDLAGRAVGWFVAFAFAFLLAWTIGQLVRTRNRARANKAAMIVAEQEVVAEQERTRIARDMHDVVAHSLAVIVAQADGGRYASRVDPVAAEESLATIAATAREALGDVRVLLAQLRYSQEDGPQPTLGDLDRLFAGMRAAGLQVEREETGTRPVLGAAQQIAIYRIVQESLTNALRHADTAREVLVRMAWAEHGLDLTIQSHLPDVRTRTGMIPVAGASTGHGLAGMTERANLAGGWLRAAAVDGRFVVTAWLPSMHAVSPTALTVKEPAE